jgi:hypothetical protein
LPEIASALSLGEDKTLALLGKMTDLGTVKAEKMLRGIFYKI